MTERTTDAARDQGATKRESAAAAAGQQPADRPADQRSADYLPPEESAVRDGGAYMGGRSPGDADDAGDEDRKPLDSREAFGGDGARYVDPTLGGSAEQTDGRTQRTAATAPGEEGFEPTAEPGVHQES
jgi:hypothetical protein